MKIIGIGIALFVAVLTGLTVMGWVSLPFEKVSPENVQKQWAFTYQYDESLQAAARQVCSAKRSVLAAVSDEEKTARRSQELAYEQNYSRIESEYNQKLRNAFEAKYVRPSDVPARAESLDDMVSRVCR